MAPRWRAIAPLHPSYPDANDCLAAPFDLGHGIRIGPSSQWPLSDEDLQDYSREHRTLAQRTRFAIVAEYEAEPGEVETAATLTGRTLRTKQDSAMLRIRLANLALWLARPTAIGFDLIFHQRETDGTFRPEPSPAAIWWRIFPWRPYRDASLREGDLEVAKSRFEALQGLDREGAVWVSAQVLFKALSDYEWVIRFPLLWIAIEAALGADDTREVSHQLAERAALLLKDDPGEAKSYYHQFKKDYVWRSKVIHGMRVIGSNDAEAEAVLLRTEDSIRAFLNCVLSDAGLTSKLNGSGRDLYLSELAFRAAGITLSSQ